MSAAEDRVRLATKEEVVEALRICERTFEKKVGPSLPSVKVGRRKLYRWEDVEAWIESNTVGPSIETSAPETGSSGFGTMAGGSTGPRARRFEERLSKSRGGSTKRRRRVDAPG